MSLEVAELEVEKAQERLDDAVDSFKCAWIKKHGPDLKYEYYRNLTSNPLIKELDEDLGEVMETYQKLFRKRYGTERDWGDRRGEIHTDEKRVFFKK